MQNEWNRKFLFSIFLCSEILLVVNEMAKYKPTSRHPSIQVGSSGTDLIIVSFSWQVFCVFKEVKDLFAAYS